MGLGGNSGWQTASDSTLEQGGPKCIKCITYSPHISKDFSARALFLPLAM